MATDKTLSADGEQPAMVDTPDPPQPKERIVRITVDLPESMHTDFSVLAAKCRKSKAELLRMAIAQMLKYEEGDEVVG